MRVQAVRTTRVGRQGADLEEFIADHVPHCPDSSVLAVTSKIVALCQGRVLDPATVPSREELLARESSRYLPADANRYHVALAIKSGRLIPNAGIDQSNADGCLVLWPQDAQKAANQLRQSLCRRLGRRRIGVLITDSTTAPLRAGVVGVRVAHSGSSPCGTTWGSQTCSGARCA